MEGLQPSEDTTPPETNNPVLILLRQALDRQDKELLRTIVNGIQDVIECCGKTKCAYMSEKELETLLKTGQGRIDVASGTRGERIYIQNGELFMPIDENHGQRYQNEFRRLFNIDNTVDELRVRF